jgi:nucleoside-diphosphate-sugar epimerase
MILVTGANGFVGSAVLKHLKAQGHEVCGLVRATSDLKRLKDTGVLLRYADLNDTGALNSALRGCNTVVHCAARSLDFGKKHQFKNANVKGVVNLISAAHKAETVRQIVLISTANVSGYGKRNVGEFENEQEKLRFLYSKSKREGEQRAQELCAASGIKLVILRPSAVYGPEDWKWSYEMIARIDCASWPLINRGRAVFTPLYIDNLCQAVENATQIGKNGGVYNLTDDVVVTWFDFCEKIARCLKKPLKYSSVPFFFAIVISFLFEGAHRTVLRNKNPKITRYRIIRSAKDFHYSCALAKKELHYTPDRDMDAHIAKTVLWYRAVKNAHSSSG